MTWVDPVGIQSRANLYLASLIKGQSLSLDLVSLHAAAKKFDALELPRPIDESTVEGLQSNEEGNSESEENTSQAPSPQSPAPALEIRCSSLQRLNGDIKTHAPEWKRLAAARMALYVFCETPGDKARLESLLRDAGVLPNPSIRTVQGRLSGGFDLREAGLGRSQRARNLRAHQTSRRTSRGSHQAS